MRKTKNIILSTLILVSMTACAQYKNFDEMATDMAKGDVPTLRANDVASSIKKGEEIILLDAREKKEYEVSSIKGSQFVGYDYFKKSSVKDIPKDSKVVVYCSVGYRSCKIGEKLQDMGFTNVHNMYGGIFDWVNNGNEVVDQSNKPTKKAHSYNEDWGKWLIRGEKVN